jgi:nicotinamide mononucleotide adenylyltransferase
MAAPGQRVVLLACGSFNPPTIMHLRLFELARDHFRAHLPHSPVVGGVMSPTHDAYAKASLIPAQHRLEMARRAAQESGWLQVSDWETVQEGWTRTRKVLDSYSSLAAAGPCPGWLPTPGSPDQGPLAFKLLCGADLLESFSTPNLWDQEDLTTIVRDYGIVVVSREGSNPERFIYESDLLTRYRRNIHIVTEWIGNEGGTNRSFPPVTLLPLQLCNPPLSPQ